MVDVGAERASLKPCRSRRVGLLIDYVGVRAPFKDEHVVKVTRAPTDIHSNQYDMA